MQQVLSPIDCVTRESFDSKVNTNIWFFFHSDMKKGELTMLFMPEANDHPTWPVNFGVGGHTLTTPTLHPLRSPYATNSTYEWFEKLWQPVSQVVSSASFLAEIVMKSPRKLTIFIIKRIILSDESIQKIFNLILRTGALVVSNTNLRVEFSVDGFSLIRV